MCVCAYQYESFQVKCGRLEREHEESYNYQNHHPNLAQALKEEENGREGGREGGEGE